MIEAWKASVVARGFSEDDCVAVYVDWLEKISREQMKGVTRTMSDDMIMKMMAEELAEMGRTHNVVMWTATQATRDAEGREFLERKHTAHSIHLHDPLDLSMGIAPVLATNDQKSANAFVDAENAAYAGVTDRQLMASIMKARYAGTTGQFTEFYQGPTLRFWNNKDDFINATDLVRAGKMDVLYKTMVGKMKERSHGGR